MGCVCLLGLGGCYTDNVVSEPQAVVGVIDAVAVSVTYPEVCVLRAGGMVSCWGGYGCVPGTVEEGPRPDATQIAGLVGATRLGEQSRCAIDAAGGLLCWGANESGCVAEAFELDSFGAADEVSAGCFRHGGTVSCTVFPLGDGSSRLSSELPVAAIGIDDAVDLAATTNARCVAHATGAVSCWGDTHPAGGRLMTPTLVDGVSDVTAVDVAQERACVVHGDGGVSCWGKNFLGQAGNGTLDEPADPRRVLGLTDVVDLDISYMSSCAVTAGGAVFCWGGGPAAADGSLAEGATPTRVPGIDDAVDVSVSDRVACAVRASGAVMCWGNHDHGFLGDGTYVDPAGG